MPDPSQGLLRIGDWQVNSATGEISRNGQTIRLETRTMRLLLCLAEHPGEVVSIEELLDQVWSGVNVSPDSVYQAVASLRRQLGDDSKQPKYIETIPRLGYRMVAEVSSSPRSANLTTAVEPSHSNAQPQASRPIGARRLSAMGFAGLCLLFVAVAIFALRQNVSHRQNSDSSALAAQPQKSVAVLPFLDLTEGMKEGEFTDGMTEELIDKNQQDSRLSRARAHLFLLLQRQTAPGRRDRESAERLLCTRWQRAQERRSSSHCRPPGSR
jgi:transcriptional activator of cad operon